MKAKPKKVKTPSRLDKLGIDIAALKDKVREQGWELGRVQSRADKQDATITRETSALREQFQLTDEWRTRALKAEAALAPPPDAAPTQNEKYWTSRLENEQAKFEALEKSYEYAQKTLDQFKREDEARAFAIREIVRPFGFDLFAPMDAVRELAKMVFSQRDQIEGGKATEALLRETIKKMALLKASPPPDCSCVRYTDSETPLTDSVVGEIVLYGTWEGRTAIAMRKCAACGGTGRKQKSRLDESATPPPDARQSATPRLYVGKFRVTEGELKEVLKLWHEGSICTCSGGQQYHRVENSECYYEPRLEGKQANPSPAEAGQSTGIPIPRRVQEYMDKTGATITLWESSGFIYLSNGTIMQDREIPDNPAGEPTPRSEGKPIRLLVEIVPKKDSKHGTTVHRFERDGGLTLEVSRDQQYTYAPAMSVQELPALPSLTDMWAAFYRREENIPQLRPGSMIEVARLFGVEVL